MNFTSTALFGVTLLAFGADRASAQCEVQELNSSDTANSDRFGNAVDIRGDVAIIGDPRDDELINNGGAAYVFRFNGTSWVEEAKIADANPGSNYQFGEAVTIDGNVAVVGVSDDDDLGSTAGAASVFRYDGANWNFETELTASDFAAGDRFGWDVDLDGDVLVVGAKMKHEGGVSDTGAAYVFRYNGTTWVEEMKLVASDAVSIAQFGDSVSLDGDTIVVGAWQDDDDIDNFTGSAYVFTYNGTTWTEQQKLKASDATAFNWFGRSVDVLGDTAVVGAYSAMGAVADSGAAYIFTRSGTTWTEAAKVSASDGAASDRFGWSSTLCEGGAGVAIGADRRDLEGTTTSAGGFYVFRDVGGTWMESGAFTTSDLGTGDDLAEHIAADGDRIIVGAKDNDSLGAAYIFSKGAECDGIQPSICFGDGGDQMGCTNCPCGNNAAAGSGTGCLNSSGTGAIMTATGDPSVMADTLRITVTDATPSTFGILASADNQLPNMGACAAGSGVTSPVLDGLRCIGGALQRHGTRPTDTNGDIGITTNGWGPPNGPLGGLIANGGFVQGQTRNYQVFYRDNTALGCLTGQNTTNAIPVIFTP